MKLWRESRALTICGTTVSSYPCTPGKSVSLFSMARSRLQRISSLTERDAPRGSKSGMPLSSPSVRGLECAEDCIDVLDVISVPFRSPRLGRGPHQTNSGHVHYHQHVGAWPLTSVDAGPTRGGTLPGAPGGPPPTEAPGFAASTIGPSAAWRQRDKRVPQVRRLGDSSDSRRRSACGRLRTASSVRLRGEHLQLFSGIGCLELRGGLRKHLYQRDFLEQGEAQNLQHGVEFQVQSQTFAHHGHQHIDGDGRPDSRFHSVLGESLERFDAQVLPDPIHPAKLTAKLFRRVRSGGLPFRSWRVDRFFWRRRRCRLRESAWLRWCGIRGRGVGRTSDKRECNPHYVPEAFENARRLRRGRHCSCTP